MSSTSPPPKAFTTRYNGHTNVLRTQVKISAPFQSDSKSTVPSDIVSGAKEFVCIWDTGATNSVITQRVADECGLRPTGMTRVHTASGTDSCETFLVSVFLPNMVAFPALKVTKGTIAGADVLIGMDIICSGDFAVTHRNGKTVLSFSMPSIREIDFVGKPNPLERRNKVGRNDPCPCGSGQKFKKCCGR